MIHTAHEIHNWDTMYSDDGKHWYPARPENYKYESLFRRLRNAWGVVIGKYDALSWTKPY